MSAKHIILATGARARSLPGLEPDGKLVWTYKEAMVPETMPKSLLVIGSGAISIEFASFYSDLGADVTVVEVMDRVLPVEDEEISAMARKAFETRGMTIHTGVRVSGLETGANNVTATIEIGDGKLKEMVDRVIIAVGMAGNVVKTSALKTRRSRSTAGMWSSTSGWKPASPACMPSVIWPDHPGWRIRPVTRGLSASRRSPERNHPLTNR